MFFFFLVMRDLELVGEVGGELINGFLFVGGFLEFLFG